LGLRGRAGADLVGMCGVPCGIPQWMCNIMREKTV
jgi:hypothetical protein